MCLEEGCVINYNTQLYRYCKAMIVHNDVSEKRSVVNSF
jgi:hypothetical protein